MYCGTGDVCPLILSCLYSSRRFEPEVCWLDEDIVRIFWATSTCDAFTSPYTATVAVKLHIGLVQNIWTYFLIASPMDHHHYLVWTCSRGTSLELRTLTETTPFAQVDVKGYFKSIKNAYFKATRISILSQDRPSPAQTAKPRSDKGILVCNGVRESKQWLWRTVQPAREKKTHQERAN
jgi:hypothetical protein